MEQQMADVNDSQDNNRNVSIRALRRKTRTMISTLLNPLKVIPNEKGLPRDWQGLAELCGISGEKIPSLQQDSDPSNKVLVLWSEKDKIESTIEKLILNLEELDRFDIIDDIESLIDEDITIFKNNPNGFKTTPPNLDADKYILTVDDVTRLNEGLEPQTYDAFVLFADDDIDFATLLIETMEKEYNMKFCAKDRDLVGGGIEHDSVIKLISERCGRLIVIVSPAFLDSSANKFFYSFAQAIGIEQRQRKIVPCLYKHCDNLPPELSCYFMLDYNRSGKFWNFWQRLNNSLKTPQYKPVSENNISFNNRSLMQHSSSSSNQCLLKPAVDLNSVENEKIIPEEFSGLSTCNSATSIKSQKSFYKKMKKIFKPKNTNNSEVPKVNEIEVEKKKKHFFRKKVALAS